MITRRDQKNVTSQGLITFEELLVYFEATPNPLQEAQIDQGVGKRVNICDCVAIAKMWTFNAEIDCLTIDPFGSRALIVNFFVSLDFADPTNIAIVRQC